jgi:hypothetical protein
MVCGGFPSVVHTEPQALLFSLYSESGSSGTSSKKLSLTAPLFCSLAACPVPFLCLALLLLAYYSLLFIVFFFDVGSPSRKKLHEWILAAAVSLGFRTALAQ